MLFLDGSRPTKLSMSKSRSRLRARSRLHEHGVLRQKLSSCRRWRVKKAIVFVVFQIMFALAAMGQQPAAPRTQLKIGDPAPDFTLTDNNGRQVRLSDFKGRKS